MICRCLIQNTYWDVELSSLRPEILWYPTAKCCRCYMAQSNNINKTHFLPLHSTVFDLNQICRVDDQNFLNLGGFHSPQLLAPPYQHSCTYKKLCKMYNLSQRGQFNTNKNYKIRAPTCLRNSFCSCSIFLKSVWKLCYVCNLILILLHVATNS